MAALENLQDKKNFFLLLRRNQFMFQCHLLSLQSERCTSLSRFQLAPCYPKQVMVSNSSTKQRQPCPYEGRNPSFHRHNNIKQINYSKRKVPHATNIPCQTNQKSNTLHIAQPDKSLPKGHDNCCFSDIQITQQMVNF